MVHERPKRLVDQPLAGNAIQAGEGGAFDRQEEVRFAPFPAIAAVAAMLLAVVAERQAGGRERRLEPLGHFPGHRTHVRGVHDPYIRWLAEQDRLMASRSPKFHGRVEGAAAHCAVPGCAEPGEFRAPLTAPTFDGPGKWQWLCLEHVRQHNARYNYFAGMTPDEIEAAQSPIAGWERQTRAFATAGAGPGPAWSDFTDPLDAISARFRPGMARPAVDRFTAGERHALGVMGLKDDADRMALRRRYSELVRQYHPDRNGGDRGYEGKLGKVIEAYQLLKGSRAFA